MAVPNLKDKLERLSIPSNTEDIEQANYRKENRERLRQEFIEALNKLSKEK